MGGGVGGAGVGGVDELETSRRLNERLNQPQTVDVQINSRTRGGIENARVTIDPANPNEVTVESASGRTYTVDPEGEDCNCIHHRTSGTRCRHIQAAEIARGMIGQEADRAETDADQALEYLNEQDIQEEEERIQNNQTEVDDGFFYMDNMSEFRENLEQFSNEPLPYEYENVLNGNDVTFGVELEFVNGDSNAIAAELYDLGICSSNRMVGYHSPSVEGKWKLEYDGTVTSGGRGGELVSPILKDTPETWQDIEKICEVAKRHGAQINYQCGGHVHVEMKNLDHARQRWRRFFKTIAGTEATIYRFSGGPEGRVRSGYRSYASPFRTAALSASTFRQRVTNMFEVRSLAADVGSDRYKGINLRNLASGRSPTVEFRYFNGSVEPGQIQANVKMAAGIMRASEVARSQDSTEYQVTDNQKRRGGILSEMNNGKSQIGMARLLDFAFSRKSDKEHILRVLSKNEYA
jgi:hypothetical protein